MNASITHNRFAKQHIYAKSNISNREKIISSHDIIPYVNAELAALNSCVIPVLSTRGYAHV
jgi:hypothetical protein